QLRENSEWRTVRGSLIGIIPDRIRILLSPAGYRKLQKKTKAENQPKQESANRHQTSCYLISDTYTPSWTLVSQAERSLHSKARILSYQHASCRCSCIQAQQQAGVCVNDVTSCIQARNLRSGLSACRR